MCDQSAQVHRYHDGCLTAQSKSEVEQHLAECGECAALLADLRRLSRMIADASLAEMPADALRRVRAARQVAHDRGVLRIASWLTAAAAAIVFAALLARPAPPTDFRNGTASAAVWQTRAVTPPDDAESDLLVVAQWMADELGSEGR